MTGNRLCGGVAALLLTGLVACGSDAGTPPPDPQTNPMSGPPAGNASGGCAVPAAGQLEDVSKPTSVVGTGTAASCTSDAVVAAVAKGGVITFSCGPDPVTITMLASDIAIASS